MLNAIKALLNPQSDNDADLAGAFKNQPKLAVAALMVEVMAADHAQDKAYLNRPCRRMHQLQIILLLPAKSIISTAWPKKFS